MKKTFINLSILMLAASSFIACGDDDKVEKADLKEYTLQVRFNISPNDSTVENQVDQAIVAALSAVGLDKNNDYLYISARDSADAAPKVQEIGKTLETVLDKSASMLYGDAYIMAIEKQELAASDSKQHSWACWYSAEYPMSENSTTQPAKEPTWSRNTFYIYELEIYNSKTNDLRYPPSEIIDVDEYATFYQSVDSQDLNEYAGGSYLKLIMRGINKANHPEYGKKLITDVVMLNTEKDSHYPEYVDITKDGKSRRYYPVFTADKGADGSTKHDLNDKAGYPYLWMYYTTDDYDGWVLANQTVKTGTQKFVSSVVTTTYRTTSEDRRYMRAYKKNAAGEWKDYGDADMNEGAGIFSRDIFYFMAFRKVM